ncbi:MAG: serine hydrolase [Acetatifactor sp.]|nr:serine hydrolase [Acetatifactor sp.]
MKMRISEIAALAGVSVRTLQYYDSIGLLKPSETDSNGFRIYDENSVEQLKKILYYRGLDLPLKDISEILARENLIYVKLTERRLALSNQKRHIEKLISEIDDRLSEPTKIDNWFDKVLQDYNYSGFAYCRDTFCVWGKADYENNTPFYLNSRFPIDGMTRLFTAFCVFIFENMGLLNTDDYLNKYMKEFVYGDKIKIYHLITMTSGISDKILEEKWNEAVNKEFSSYTEDLSYARRILILHNIQQSFMKKKSFNEILEIINHESLKFIPGEENEYSAINYEILGAILEQISGRSIDKIFEEYIFRPLEMNDTSFFGNMDIVGYVNDIPLKTLFACDASKGIITTAADLSKWCSALIEGKLISEKGRYCFASKIFGHGKYTEYGQMGEIYSELKVDITEKEYFISVRNRAPVPYNKARVMYYPIKACDDGYVKFEIWEMQRGSEVRVDSIKIFDKNAEELFSEKSVGICVKNDGEERHASDFIDDDSYYYELNLSDVLKDRFDSKETYIAEVRAQCEEYQSAQFGVVYLHDGEWQSSYFNAFYCYESAYPLFMEALNAIPL